MGAVERGLQHLDVGEDAGRQAHDVGALVSRWDEPSQGGASSRDAVPQCRSFDGTSVPDGVDELALGGVAPAAGEEGDEVELEAPEPGVLVDARRAKHAHEQTWYGWLPIIVGVNVEGGRIGLEWAEVIPGCQTRL